MSDTFLIAVVSGVAWFIFDVVLTDSDGVFVRRFNAWFVRVCQILFAAAVFAQVFKLAKGL
jgi:hypothetical protein